MPIVLHFDLESSIGRSNTHAGILSDPPASCQARMDWSTGRHHVIPERSPPAFPVHAFQRLGGRPAGGYLACSTASVGRVSP